MSPPEFRERISEKLKTKECACGHGYSGHGSSFCSTLRHNFLNGLFGLKACSLVLLSLREYCMVRPRLRPYLLIRPTALLLLSLVPRLAFMSIAMEAG